MTQASEPDFDSVQTTQSNWNPLVQAQYTPDNGRDLSTVIAESLAQVHDVSVTELQSPLYDSMDIEAVEDMFFSTTRTSKPATQGVLEFLHDGVLITVRSDGWVQVSEPTSDEVRDKFID